MNFLELKEKIESFSHLKENWDSYGSGLIEQNVISGAKQILNELNQYNLIPERVSATGDQSILFQFVDSNFLIDVYADCAVVLQKLDNEHTSVYEVEYNEVIDLVKKLLKL